ncbi:MULTISPECIES: lipoprotein [unclassified Luteimonas]|uniref:LPS translocon maturation chaperone LptM n=1 Tax=unclassified Luteimonas TaxID=2629088 RepID=UPI0018F08235|nr:MULTISPECIES: lipoprotein [unclassified Luteimonas]MBJ6981628.1 hypothetical protein [Luteimonas sp. MC1572]MBJ7575805.1 hypothetical protein [Luteimonas sp. MC1828]QQO02923.1 hypothetical protein JGR64_12285 [Luteimonas sp. MC1572]
MNIRPLLPATLLSALLLSACGNKGPLLPPPAPDAEPAPSAAAIDAGAEADPRPVDELDPPLPTEPVTVPVDVPVDGEEPPAVDDDGDDDNG